MVSDFEIVGLGKPNYIACWTEDQYTFYPSIAMKQDRFDAFFLYCKGNWDEKKIAVVEYEQEINGIPVNSKLLEIKLV